MGTEGEGSDPTVGQVRELLARHGIPDTPETHFAIAASAPGRGLAVICCCDGLQHVADLMGAAVEEVTGEPQVTAASRSVIVSREDLQVFFAKLGGRRFFVAGEAANAEARLRLAAVPDGRRPQ